MHILQADGPTLVGKVKGIYGFKVKGGPGGAEGFWIVDAKNGSGNVVFNGTGKGGRKYLGFSEVKVSRVFNVCKTLYQ